MTFGRMLAIVQRNTTRAVLARALGVELEIPATKLLADGTVGYCVRAPRRDDCFAAALATCLQVPIDELPDPRIDERLDAGETPDEINRAASVALAVWLQTADLRMVIHHKLPPRRRRWIGVIPMAGDFQDHCVVLNGREILFDPAVWQPVAGSDPVADENVVAYTFHDVTYGLSFQPITTRKDQ